MDGKILSMDKIFIRQKYLWMEKSYPRIKVSSMEKICGCYPWMKSTDEDDG